MKTEIEHRPYLNGRLEVHVTRDDDGNIVQEAFAFASLADVLDIPLSTLEGRYARSNAKQKKINLRTGAGRPARGFPMALLDAVVEAMTSTDARFTTPDGVPRSIAEGRPLVPLIHNGLPHYTVQSLADHYGVTAQTIRNKIKAAGLGEYMVPTSTTAQGGRPRMAFRAEDLPRVQLAIAGVPTPASPAPVTPVAASAATTTPVAPTAPATPAHPYPAGRSGVHDPVVARLVAEIEQAVAEIPTPEDTTPLALRQAQMEGEREAYRRSFDYSGAQYHPAHSVDHWLSLVAEASLDHITKRWEVEQADFEITVQRLDGQGKPLGLSMTLDAYSDYVFAMRERVRAHVVPYEDMVVRLVDDLAPADGEVDLAFLFALRRAIATVPVYVGQLPFDVVYRRGCRYGFTMDWKKLIGKHGSAQDSEYAQQRMMGSTAYRNHYATLCDTLRRAIDEVDAEHGVHVGLRPGYEETFLDVRADGVILPYPLDNR